MKILEVEKTRVYVEFPNGMRIWLDEEILKAYGVNFKTLRVGQVVPTP